MVKMPAINIHTGDWEGGCDACVFLEAGSWVQEMVEMRPDPEEIEAQEGFLLGLLLETEKIHSSDQEQVRQTVP